MLITNGFAFVWVFENISFTIKTTDKMSTNVEGQSVSPNDAKPVLPAVKFLIRQMNGIQRGELTLDDDTSKLYRDGSHDDKVSIRLKLCVGASKHFKTECYVSEILNGG